METPIPTRYAFVMLLAICDPQGYVIGTDVAIARRINMPLDEFTDAVGQLSAPDGDSNSAEEQGRRLIPSDGERGYRIVNYLTYSQMKDESGRREYMRDYQRKRRARERGEANCKHPVNTRKQFVTHVDVNEDENANANADAETEVETEIPASAGKSLSPKSSKGRASLAEWTGYAATLTPPFPEREAERAWNYYESNGWLVGKSKAPSKDWQACCRTCHGRWKTESANAINGRSNAAKPRGGPCPGDPCPITPLREFDFENPGTIPGPPP